MALLSKSVSLMKKLCRGAIGQDSEARDLHTIHDLVDPPILEPEVIEHPMQEG